MTKVKLSAMLFLQYLMMPVWFVPLLPYVRALDGGSEWLFAFGLLMGVGTLASPLVCMVADRFFNAERVLAGCYAVHGALLAGAFLTTSPAVLFALMLPAVLAYMPTWSLSTAVAMAHVAPSEFPKLRVFGSFGWVASAAFSVVGTKAFGIVDFDLSHWIFASGALVAFAGTLLALTLPATPPKAKGSPLSLSEAFGLKAFTLFADRRFAAFFVLFLLAQVPFEWYMVYNPVYLSESGFKYLTLTQNVGQVAEVLLMLTVPLVVKRFGYRVAFASGIAAIAIRYAAFLGSVRFGVSALDFVGIFMQGAIFGYLVVVGQMFIGERAPEALRNQAQGMVVLLATGVGVFLSNGVFDALLKTAERAGGHDWTMPFAVAGGLALVLAVAAWMLFRPGEEQAR